MPKKEITAGYAASGFAGYLFPSLRARGYGEEKPRPPYEIIIYKEGEKIKADTRKGKTIAEGQSEIDDTDVIQSAVSNVSAGRVYFENTSYKITNTISCSSCIEIVSSGALLDLSSLNTVAFRFGSEESVSACLASLCGFKVEGSSTNSSTRLVEVNRIVRGFHLERIHHKNLNNLIEAKGECFDITIRDCFGSRLKGDWIRLVTLDIDSIPRKPNNAAIQNCEISNSWSETGGRGILIFSSNEDATVSGAVGTVKIHNCWLEALDVGVYSESRNTIISDSHFGCVDKCIHINTKEIDGQYMAYSGNAALVEDNYISISEATTFGIYLDGAPRQHVISDNYFCWCRGVGIHCTNKQRITCEGNVFEAGSSDAKFITGYLTHSRIVGNLILGDLSNPRGQGVNASGLSVVISSNQFVGLDYPIFSPNLNWAQADDNIFYGNNNDPVLGTKYRNSGIETFSGDGTTTQFSIAHGLVSEPSKVLVTPMTEDAAGDFYVTKDATNIYVNYLSAPPSGSNNVKLSWYAEV